MWSWNLIVVLHLAEFNWWFLRNRTVQYEILGSGIFQWICCVICVWPPSPCSFLSPVECTLGAPKWDGPCRRWDARVAMTWRSKVAFWHLGMVMLMGKVGKEALEKKHFCKISAGSLVILVFQALFWDFWRYLEAQCRFYESMIFGVVVGVVVGYESSLNGRPFWASLWIGFQDLKFLAFSAMDLTLKAWMLKFLYLLPRKLSLERKLTWQWNITFFKWLGFSRCHFSFPGFFIWFVEIVLLRLFGSSPSSPKRKSADQIALAKIQDDITCHLSRRMQEPFEWILNILTLILQDTPGGNTVTCTSVIETLKWHIFNWKTYIFQLELQDTTLTIKQIIRQLFNDLIVSVTKIIPDLSQIQFFLQVVPASNQCLPYRPMWHPMSFSPAKRVFFSVGDSVANHYLRRVGCGFPLFPCFSHFAFFHIGQRRGVLLVTMFFAKGVQLQLDEWP